MHLACAIWIVEIKHGCLLPRGQRAEATGMGRIAFEFGRSTIEARHKHARGDPALFNNACVLLGNPGDATFGSMGVRSDDFTGPSAAAGQPDSSKCHGRTHDLEESPTVWTVEHCLGPTRKLAIQKVAKFRRVSNLIEATPISAAVRAASIYRWHVVQSCEG